MLRVARDNGMNEIERTIVGEIVHFFRETAERLSCRSSLDNDYRFFSSHMPRLRAMASAGRMAVEAGLATRVVFSTRSRFVRPHVRLCVPQPRLWS